MKQKIMALPVSLLIAMLSVAGCQVSPVRPIEAEAPAEAPREVVVLSGAGQDTHLINAFLPSVLKIRAGDTVTWKINSDEPHTATFLSGAEPPPDPIPMPGGGPTDLMLNPQIAFSTRAPDAPVEIYSGDGYFNSGLLSNGVVVAPNESYSVSFDTPGTYKYNCLLHQSMVGTIIVEPNTTVDVPSQADIDAMAQAELAPLEAQLEALTSATPPVHSELGPGDTTIWYVPAGYEATDDRVAVYDFAPKDLTIKQGDTIVWTSTLFHVVSFFPGRDAPEFVIPIPQDQGPPILQVNPEVAFPAKPSGEFDGTGYYSSGLIGAGPLPGGMNFSMTFSEPGTYDYVCPIHKELGMAGTVTVTQR